MRLRFFVAKLSHMQCGFTVGYLWVDFPKTRKNYAPVQSYVVYFFVMSYAFLPLYSFLSSSWTLVKNFSLGRPISFACVFSISASSSAA